MESLDHPKLSIWPNISDLSPDLDVRVGTAIYQLEKGNNDIDQKKYLWKWQKLQVVHGVQERKQ